jgi:hypothetical protein
MSLSALSHREALARLQELENRLPLHEFYWKGESFWPVLRVKLFNRWIFAGNEAAPPSPKEKSLATKLGNVRDFILRQLEPSAQSATPVNALFFSQELHHTDQIDGKRFDRHIDPLIRLIEQQGFSAQKIGLRTLERTEAGQYAIPWEALRSHWTSSILFRFEKRLFLRKFKTHSALCRVLESSGLSLEDLARAVSSVFFFERGFGRLIERMKPRAVFVACYWSPIAMGLMLAATRRNVLSVDVQHGKRGPHAAYYTGWLKVPSSGYGTLPSYFWVWGIPSFKQIKNCDLAGREDEHHRALLGGSPWHLHWTNRENADQAWQAYPALRTSLAGATRVVLVSLQPLEGPLLPEIILESIRFGSPDWFWLMRIHPHQRNRIPEAQKILRERGLKNADIEDASLAPLMILIPETHLHVTHSSSVAYDAMEYGIRTVFIDPNSRSNEANYFQAGLFLEASNAKELVDHIWKSGEIEPTQLPNEDRFIECSSEVAQRALGIILAKK